MPSLKSPAPGEPSALQRFAQTHGIQTSYLDNGGRRQYASEETLRLILERLGVNSSSGVQGEPSLRVIEPVIPAWQNARNALLVRLPAREMRDAQLRLRLETGEEECIPLHELIPDGGEKPTSHRVLPLSAPSALTPAGRKFAELRLDIPELPLGYHSLSVESASGSWDSMLISAPKKLYAEKSRQWGAFIPMYAVHSEKSWGAGNFSDWRELCQWLGSLGGKVAGTLPVMAAFLDQPTCEPSPYSPASRLFWNEFFIDISAVPEFQNSAAAKKLAGSADLTRKIAAFRRAEFIDYREEWSVRRRVLELLAKEFFAQTSQRYGAFRAFLQARPEVEEYARFRAMCDATGSSWHTWNDAAKSGSLTGYSEETKSFYLYIQWLAQQQMDDVLQACRKQNVKFYLDLPLGVNPDGFDAWRYRDFFAPQVSAGAPPDSFFTKGQDWGFAPLHPQRTRELKYRYVIDYLRFQMRHTGLLRIDHVMGLHRLWWVPHGHPASAGAYVSYPAEELYAILSVESHRHRTTLVGENLGTVPPEVNKSMDRHGLRKMYVLQYEQPAKGPLREPEPQVVASLNTHDMPSFAAHWKGLDIDDRIDLGLIPKKNLAREKASRQQLRENLITFLRKKKLLSNPRPKTQDILEALLKILAQSPAETILVTLEDLWGEERSQNVPGTHLERPNWRRKSARTLEQLRSDPHLQSLLRKLLQR